MPRISEDATIILASADVDVAQSYDLGGNSFISKPAIFDDFVHSMRCLGRYWFGVVRRPDEVVRPEAG